VRFNFKMTDSNMSGYFEKSSRRGVVNAVLEDR
jgi:hypothetical protein